MAPSRLYQQPHNQQPNNRLAVSTGIAGQSPVPQCHESRITVTCPPVAPLSAVCHPSPMTTLHDFTATTIDGTASR